MKEAQAEFNQFRQKTLKPSEKVAFAVVCGDFNFDNISPGKDNYESRLIYRIEPNFEFWIKWAFNLSVCVHYAKI